MPGIRSDLEGFFARPVPLTLERILVVDYLLAQGFLPCDLENLSPEKAAALFAKARRFAIHNLSRIEPSVVLSYYLPVGFSRN